MDREKEDSLIEDLKEIQSILVSEERLLEAEALSELAEKTGLLIGLRDQKMMLSSCNSARAKARSRLSLLSAWSFLSLKGAQLDMTCLDERFDYGCAFRAIFFHLGSIRARAKDFEGPDAFA